MIDISNLPAEERAMVRERAESIYQECGGRDIDRAINRDRKVLELHERELEHVSTLPFDQHYRWRIAPSVALRAQKDLERQQARRKELLDGCTNYVLHRLKPVAPAVEADSTEAPPSAEQVEQFAEQFSEVMREVLKWQEPREGQEAPPPDTHAAA